MAMATTPPPAAPIPMSTRKRESIPMSVASAAPSEEPMCKAVARIRGSRRPTLSLKGPTSSWPSPNPTVVPVSVSWIAASDTSKLSSKAGNAGRYRSIVKGPRAVRAPSRRM
ncbi:hypothetical protein D3C73_1109510 [compost metagenome]